MSEPDKQKLNSKAVPFFARYLENQLEELSEEEMKAAVGGCPFSPVKGDYAVTNKYPSDVDEAVTMKYPSDGDDDGIAIQLDNE